MVLKRAAIKTQCHEEKREGETRYFFSYVVTVF
jgi:hypothetical protein